MSDVSTLRAQRHAPPADWDAATFERVSAALAQALVSAHRRAEREESAEDGR